ncbi:hypothetical protein XO10_02330 [Marinitoga sp. 1135]|uniref:Putative transcriptional regulator n=1 Tax=Marinitoga piezophila (strain DSM 14283 / JCM 11233 / KA3) TaxID=443254 RepID=H2J4W0_MARPK|nr:MULTISPECIES: metalloregulator ArsR/SmtB family transcription factor [Marinitoga]AEX84895.1 putative transcriptional regulator [Marinitoga piezophila KA3]APT75397.1 hypothetical protein LN42_02605 [Marinitoga sp. 1137]NUU95129.1 hypothetical protein [Marinitoga sp. 1135]NUU97061.1 hypothetical protein [Marinitoga sp. 1138]
MDNCDLLADIFKALSHPTRLRILKILNNKECNILEISEKLGLTQSSISQHIKILEDVGLIKKEKVGNIVYCELKYPHIFELFDDAKNIIHSELKSAHSIINNE